MELKTPKPVAGTGTFVARRRKGEHGEAVIRYYDSHDLKIELARYQANLYLTFQRATRK
jgi:hypothetical protein